MSWPRPDRPRLLRVTGDDFGLTPGVNAGMVHAHRHGILTHASLMVRAPFASEALALAHQAPSLAVGVHLGLVDGRPCLPPSRVPTLVDGEGRFRRTAGEFVRDWAAARIAEGEVERELRAQVEALCEAGFRPAHLDSHKHVHMWPPVFEMVVRLAGEYRVPEVRLALERPIAALALENVGDRRAFRQSIDNAMMLPLGWLARRALERHGVAPAWFLGRVHTGLLTPDRLARALRRIPPGRAELMTHPGYVDEELERVRTRLRAEREGELALLCAPGTRALLREVGIDLAGAPRGETIGGTVAEAGRRAVPRDVKDYVANRDGTTR